MHGVLGAGGTENALIQKALDGDGPAFERLMEPHLKVIYNYIRIHVSSDEDIKDILQESMLSIWMSLGSFGSQSTFKTWAMGIVRRKIADNFRAAYKAAAAPISDYEHVLVNDSETDSIVTRLDVVYAVETLSELEREIVFLAFAARQTYSEISEITGIPLGTVKSKMHSIKKKLRAQLQGGG